MANCNNLKVLARKYYKLLELRTRFLNFDKENNQSQQDS